MNEVATPAKPKASATYSARAYGASSAHAPLSGIAIPRRHPTERDVQIEILFCGICHSDLHFTRNEWDAIPASYPAVPGHEIVGRVAKVGAAVKKHKVGDVVGVGCLVDSDHTCPNCQAGLENFCANLTMTFGSVDRHGAAATTSVATRTVSSWTSASSCAFRRTWIRPLRRRSCARESRLTRRCAGRA